MSSAENLTPTDNTGHPLLSVVIPTHGRPKSLRSVIEALLVQDLSAKKFEVLVVANLPDESLTDYLAEIRKHTAIPIREYVVGRMGVNGARNLGLKETRGEFALYLDDDCTVPDRSYLTRLLRLHAEFPDHLALGGAYLSPPEATNAGMHYNWISNHWLDAQFETPRETTKLIGGAVTYKLKPLRDNSLFFDETIRYGGAETEFHERLVDHGHRLLYHPHLSVIHNPEINGLDLVRKAYLQGYAKARRAHDGTVHRDTFWKTLLIQSLFGTLYRCGFKAGERRARRPNSKPTGMLGIFFLYLCFSAWHWILHSPLKTMSVYAYWKLHAGYWKLYHLAWKLTEVIWFVREIWFRICDLGWQIKEVYWFFYRLASQLSGLVRMSFGRAYGNCVIIYWTLYPLFWNLRRHWREPSRIWHIPMPLPYPNVEAQLQPLWIGVMDRSWSADERHFSLHEYSRLGIEAVELNNEAFAGDATRFGLQSYVFIRPFSRFDFAQASFTTEKIIEIRISEINQKSAPLVNWLRSLDTEVAVHFRIDSRLEKRPAQVFFQSLRHMKRIKAFSYEMPKPGLDSAAVGFDYFRHLYRFDMLTTPYKIKWRPLYRYASDSRFLFQIQSTVTKNPFAEVSALAPKVSVIIPHHRDFTNLLPVLRRLREQTMAKPEFEVIVVDNAAPEYLLTEEQRQRIVTENSEMRFTLLTLRSESSTHWLSGHARTQGFLHSSGGTILYLDSDIMVPADFLEAVIARMQTVDVIMAKRQMLNESFDSEHTQIADIQPTDTYTEGEYWEGYKSANAWTDLQDYWKYSCTYCFGLKRSDFLKAGPFDPHFTMYGFEDVDLGFRLFKRGLKFGFVDRTVFHLFPRKDYHNYHVDQAKRVQTLMRSALTFFLLRPEKLPFAICQGYFAPTFSRWLMLPFKAIARPLFEKRKPTIESTEPETAVTVNV